MLTKRSSENTKLADIRHHQRSQYRVTDKG